MVKTKTQMRFTNIGDIDCIEYRIKSKSLTEALNRSAVLTAALGSDTVVDAQIERRKKWHVVLIVF